jgi:hypothetical protein
MSIHDKTEYAQHKWDLTQKVFAPTDPQCPKRWCYIENSGETKIQQSLQNIDETMETKRN